VSYIDEAFYDNTFHGEPVDSADFPSLSMRAGEIVEEMTMYRLTSTSFLAMPEATQDRVRRAVCAQVEYLEANGGSDMDNGADLQSAGLGKFNYSKSAGAGGSTKQSLYAPRASRYLLPTGLLYRGGGCQ
jgi:hypothetical protein